MFINFPDKAQGIRNWGMVAYPGEKKLPGLSMPI